MNDQVLIDAAVAVRENAHCPYSGFKVGAAILDEQGRMHIGCNVENAAYPEGNCAETSAIAAMIAAGGKTIETIAVAGGSNEATSCTPCGGCRQRINEFSSDTTRIIVIDDNGEWHTFSIKELLPESFHLDR